MQASRKLGRYHVVAQALMFNRRFSPIFDIYDGDPEPSKLIKRQAMPATEQGYSTEDEAIQQAFVIAQQWLAENRIG